MQWKDHEREAVRLQSTPAGWREVWRLTGAGVLGGAAAGLAGGLLYGFAAASGAESGAASVLLVLLCLTVATAAIGAAGVSFGIAAAGLIRRAPGPFAILGGAAGGLAVGAVVKLLGVDAFVLLFGRSPGDVTGAMEGAVLGGAVGLATWLARRAASPLQGLLVAGLVGALGGGLVAALGGRLMVGSLELLARSFPDSRLRLGGVGSLFGEAGFGPMSQVAVGALEGLLFAVGLAAAMNRASRR